LVVAAVFDDLDLDLDSLVDQDDPEPGTPPRPAGVPTKLEKNIYGFIYAEAGAHYWINPGLRLTGAVRHDISSPDHTSPCLFTVGATIIPGAKSTPFRAAMPLTNATMPDVNANNPNPLADNFVRRSEGDNNRDPKNSDFLEPVFVEEVEAFPVAPILAQPMNFEQEVDGLGDMNLERFRHPEPLDEFMMTSDERDALRRSGPTSLPAGSGSR
jgi:hypothetical protein